MIEQPNRGVHVWGRAFKKEEDTLSISCRENDLSLITNYTILKLLLLETLYFRWCNLNPNKIDVVGHFSKVICQIVLTCFIVHVTKISDKTDEVLLNYSNSYWRRGHLCLISQLCNKCPQNLTLRNIIIIVILYCVKRQHKRFKNTSVTH